MKKYIRLILLLISVITFISGVTQVLIPAVVLSFVGATDDPATRHLFSTIGMFMFLFGGMMIQVLYNENNNRVAVLWSGFQKLAAATAVFIGIFKGVFVPIAAGVAIFDFLSGLLFLYYLTILKRVVVS